jgi:hypothetical protein
MFEFEFGFLLFLFLGLLLFAKEFVMPSRFHEREESRRIRDYLRRRSVLYGSQEEEK